MTYAEQIEGQLDDVGGLGVHWSVLVEVPDRVVHEVGF